MTEQLALAAAIFSGCGVLYATIIHPHIRAARFPPRHVVVLYLLAGATLIAGWYFVSWALAARALMDAS